MAWSYCSESCDSVCCCWANAVSTASTWLWVAVMALDVADGESPEDALGEATAGEAAIEPMTTTADTTRATRRATACVRARQNRPVTTVTLSTVARGDSGRKGRGTFWRSLDLLRGGLYLANRG